MVMECETDRDFTVLMLYSRIRYPIHASDDTLFL